MLKILLTGLVAFTDTLAIFYFCFRALDVPIDIPALALFFVILRLSTSVTITPGNLGVRELAYGIIGAILHICSAKTIVIAIAPLLAERLLPLIKTLSFLLSEVSVIADSRYRRTVRSYSL